MRLLVFLPLLLLSTALCAQPDESGETEEAQEPEVRRTFTIRSVSEFACAEVAADRSGGQATHEIILKPRNIERCLLKKVGTRYHECIKLKIRKATVDETGVVRIDTDEGPVEFWFEQEARLTSSGATKMSQGEDKGVLTFTWPDNDWKYLCGTFK